MTTHIYMFDTTLAPSIGLSESLPDMQYEQNIFVILLQLNV